MKNSKETIGNRTRDLPVCNAVPQPTSSARAPNDVCSRQQIEVVIITVRGKSISSIIRCSPGVHMVPWMRFFVVELSSLRRISGNELEVFYYDYGKII
jgi:hypothetical protein